MHPFICSGLHFQPSLKAQTHLMFRVFKEQSVLGLFDESVERFWWPAVTFNLIRGVSQSAFGST